MYARDLHQHLIGQQGSRAALNTPALVIDAEVLERNIAVMAAFARAAGLALRPHAKTHKCAAIARAQIAAGAVGVCCAKLGEAQALLEAGIEDILITSPVAGAPAIERLAALARQHAGLKAVVDHPGTAQALDRLGVAMTLFIDVDPGLHRTGVADAEAAAELAEVIAASTSLRWGGLQYYCGSQQHIEGYAQRRAAIAERNDYLASVISRLREGGHEPRVVTGGGTGTHRIDAELGILTELQAGSYVFMDRQYGACDLADGAPAPFETSLMVDSRVISANQPFMSTVDAGLKSFSTEDGVPPILRGAPDGSTYRFMGDEQGAVLPPRGVAPPALGEVITFGAPHCDPTVNLYDAFHVVRDGTLVDIWPIEARGRSA
jgi:3-hydroxy-D-aspartate aldolase